MPRYISLWIGNELAGFAPATINQLVNIQNELFTDTYGIVEISFVKIAQR